MQITPKVQEIGGCLCSLNIIAPWLRNGRRDDAHDVGLGRVVGAFRVPGRLAHAVLEQRSEDSRIHLRPVLTGSIHEQDRFNPLQLDRIDRREDPAVEVPDL